MKRFIAILALAALVAAPAFAASTPRSVTAGLVQSDNPIVTLYTFPYVQLGTTDLCMARLAGTDDACEDVDLNQIVVARDILVTNLRMVVVVAGDASSTCDMFIELAGTAAGAEMTAVAMLPVNTIHNQGQHLFLPAGSLIGVNVTDASGCYDTTAPLIDVEIDGQYVD
jgi:hypothetical protein